jgi:hypothetical protein
MGTLVDATGDSEGSVLSFIILHELEGPIIAIDQQNQTTKTMGASAMTYLLTTIL